MNCAVLAKILMLMKGYDQRIFDKVSYFNPQDGGGDKDEGEDEIGGREKRDADPTGIITYEKHSYSILEPFVGYIGYKITGLPGGQIWPIE